MGYDWLADQHLRTWLILMLLALDVVLFVYQASTARRMKRAEATIKSLIDSYAATTRVVEAQSAMMAQGLRTLAEIAGHVEVALGRSRLSAESRAFLNGGEAPGVDPAGERLPQGPSAPPSS